MIKISKKKMIKIINFQCRKTKGINKLYKIKMTKISNRININILLKKAKKVKIKFKIINNKKGVFLNRNLNKKFSNHLNSKIINNNNRIKNKLKKLNLMLIIKINMKKNYKL